MLFTGLPLRVIRAYVNNQQPNKMKTQYKINYIQNKSSNLNFSRNNYFRRNMIPFIFVQQICFQIKFDWIVNE